MLSPYRALDLTDEKGFLCGKILGDLGADVVKIEPPGGHPARNAPPFYDDHPDPEKSLAWLAYNTSKRGITLDVESSRGRELFERLVGTADFVIESFAPGYMEGLGLGYSSLRRLNPRVVMTSITPFGQAGPYRDFEAGDLVANAMGGLMFICGDPDRPPVRISAPQSYCHAGVQAAAGTLMAHYQREYTGESQYVDVSMREAVLWTLTYATEYWHTSRHVFSRAGTQWRAFDTAYRVVLPCKDGYVAYRLGFGRMLGDDFVNFVRAMDSEGMAGELKEVDWPSQSVIQKQVDIERWEAIMISYLTKYTKKELHEKALEWDFMLYPVNDPKDIFEYRQLASRDYWVEVEHPELDTAIAYPGAFFKSSETSWGISRRAPLIGEHNRELYQDELGLSEQELHSLSADGVV